MRGLTASVVAAAVLASPAPGQVAAGGAGDAPFRQVITSDDLREYGARQLTDVLGLIDDWHHGSVDGFTWRSAPRGLGTYGEPQWLVMVDGHMVDVDLFGVRSLNRIPIALSQVDSIEVISVPAYVSGTFAGGGVLRLHTRTPPSGFSVRALGFTANETGDPGPYRFTELRTPNVDRIGSGATGALSHGGGKLTLDLAGGWQGHLVTDPPVRGRNFDITTGHYPMITQGGVSLSVGLHARGGDHRLLLAHSRSRDYFLLQPFGREVPVHSPYTHAGITGALRLGGPARIDYRVSFERNQLDKHDNTLGLDFDWELDRWRAAVTLSSRLADQPLSLSVGVERTDAGTGYELTDDDFYIGSVTGRLGYRLDARQVGSLGWRSPRRATARPSTRRSTIESRSGRCRPSRPSSPISSGSRRKTPASGCGGRGDTRSCPITAWRLPARRSRAGLARWVSICAGGGRSSATSPLSWVDTRDTCRVC